LSVVCVRAEVYPQRGRAGSPARRRDAFPGRARRRSRARSGGPSPRRRA